MMIPDESRLLTNDDIVRALDALWDHEPQKIVIWPETARLMVELGIPFPSGCLVPDTPWMTKEKP